MAEEIERIGEILSRVLSQITRDAEFYMKRTGKDEKEQSENRRGRLFHNSPGLCPCGEYRLITGLTQREQTASFFGASSRRVNPRLYTPQ